ncbi:hypothetical protein RHSIM_Rhsim02G0116800 [Rhododendron simsii]|uniref:Uncharacterized protein n=1 Tax=Rhododendron simsii TaxID=118357 RepID=A0A834HC26_RHOSS|nr:hypothetical protein RHSIM_Rhsim02G0116800 [Rhododendron simsii]
MAPVAANGPYDKAVIGLKDELVPSPAPSSGGNDPGDGGAPARNRLLTRRHSSDKFAAGGDVILGGFATALGSVPMLTLPLGRVPESPFL